MSNKLIFSILSYNKRFCCMICRIKDRTSLKLLLGNLHCLFSRITLLLELLK